MCHPAERSDLLRAAARSVHSRDGEHSARDHLKDLDFLATCGSQQGSANRSAADTPVSIPPTGRRDLPRPDAPGRMQGLAATVCLRFQMLRVQLINLGHQSELFVSCTLK